MLSAIILFFISFSSSFDFRYPIYCDPSTFSNKNRMDHLKKQIIEENLLDCEDYNSYFVK
jgi:hypothetical protein